MTILLGVIVLIAAFCIWVSMKPNQFSISRSIDIAAPALRIFGEINNLKNMNSWNPFATDDPKAQMTYSGPDAGKGAKYAWSGGKMGAGSFEVLESTPNARVRSQLLMIKPIAADNIVDFTLSPNGPNTTVTWSMSGSNRFVHKLMHTFMNMDKMMNGTFDRGLAVLKTKVEQKQLPL